MIEIIDKYNILKNQKAETILLTMSQFEFLLRKIEEMDDLEGPTR
jgi:hypothetical protein